MLDYDLGLWPGNERPAIDSHLEAAKPPQAQDLLQGLARPPAIHKGLHLEREQSRWGVIQAAEELGGVCAPDVLNHPTGLLSITEIARRCR